MGARSIRTSTGVGLHVEVDGPPDAPVTVILAHGWTLDMRSWAPVAWRLASASSPPADAGPPVQADRDHRQPRSADPLTGRGAHAAAGAGGWGDPPVGRAGHAGHGPGGCSGRRAQSCTIGKCA